MCTGFSAEKPAQATTKGLPLAFCCLSPQSPAMTDGLSENPAALLRWYVDAGVDECIGDAPVDRLAKRAPAPPAPAATAPAPIIPVARPAGQMPSPAALPADTDA